MNGFEPPLPDPESDVLPLHHTAIKSPTFPQGHINLLFDTITYFNTFNFCDIFACFDHKSHYQTLQSSTGVHDALQASIVPASCNICMIDFASSAWPVTRFAVHCLSSGFCCICCGAVGCPVAVTYSLSSVADGPRRVPRAVSEYL